MPLLARKLEKGATWADAEDEWEKGNFPFLALWELKEGHVASSKGLSFFVCRSTADKDLERLAAALYLGGEQKNISETQFRFVDTADLDRLGIAYKQTPGKISDTKFVTQHYDVTGLTGPKAVELAKCLCDSTALIVGARAVTWNLARGIRLNWFEGADIKGGSWIALNKAAAIKISERGMLR